MKIDLREFFENEIEYNTVSESILMKKAVKAEQVGSLDEAILYLNGILLINPNNQEALKLKAKLSGKLSQKTQLNIESLKEIAHSFILKYYPQEEIFFDVLWNIFEDAKSFQIRPTNSALSDAIALFNETEYESKESRSPVIIASLLGGFKKQSDNIPNINIDRFLSDVEKLAVLNGADRELLKKINIMFSSFKYK